MTPDRELLRRYVEQGSEEAFTELVRRHINMVYGTALRQLRGDVPMAEDTAQSVFTALAHKPGSSMRIVNLAGWLYSTTRFQVSHAVRTERRRREREQKAHVMQMIYTGDSSRDRTEVPSELLDEVIERLDEDEREAILHRFFEGQSFPEMGSILDISEDAARMRVNRALEKIRKLFEKNGITSSAGAIAAALANQVVAVPAGLASSISSAALAGAATLSAASTVKVGIIALMSTTKTALFIASTAAIVAIGYSTYEFRQATTQRDVIATLTRDNERLEDAIKQREHEAASLSHRAVLSEQEAAILQRKLNEFAARASPPAANAVPNSEEETRRLAAEKMAQMKPLLEAGMPIKGAVLLYVDGKPVDQPVSFVIGKETRIAGDDGTYSVTPSLNQNGSVRYACNLLQANPNGGAEQVISRNVVVAAPWGDFTFERFDNGTAMGFVPDMAGP